MSPKCVLKYMKLFLLFGNLVNQTISFLFCEQYLYGMSCEVAPSSKETDKYSSRAVSSFLGGPVLNRQEDFKPFNDLWQCITVGS